MLHPDQNAERPPRDGLLPAARVLQLLGLGGAAVLASWAVDRADVSTALLFAGLGLAGVAVFAMAAEIARIARAPLGLGGIAAFIEHDALPTVTTDRDGRVIHMNRTARSRFGDRAATSLVALLEGHFASPSALVFRMQERAAAVGTAREDVALRLGHLRVTVHRLTQKKYLWRLEDIAERASRGQGAERIGLPMLVAADDGIIHYMNEAMFGLVGKRHKTLDRIVGDLPIRCGDTHTVATANGPARLPITEIAGPTGRREIYVLPETSATGLGEWETLEHLPVPLLKLSSEGVVLGSNREAKALLSIEGEDRPGLSTLVEGLGRPVDAWVAEAADGRGTGRPEFLRASRASQDVFVQMTLSRYRADDGAAVIAVLNDATELKTLEAQFVQSQKMQAIGQLAGGVAHDFNNLLTAITGHCDLLLLRRDPGDPDFADLEQINQNANRAAALVSQLLAFSRKQNMRAEILDVGDLLGDLGHLLNRLVGETISLEVALDPETRKIRADRRQFEQVFMNLVVNARDAMPDGGAIEIETRNASLAEDLVRDRAVVPEGDYVVIQVRDHGVGIPPESLSKVFEPFYTTKKAGEGTGLGLSTVYGIIKQTGGFIFVDSVPGQGTEFTLYFPGHDAVEERKAAPKQDDRPARINRGEGVVLLVEDEAPVRAFASRALRMRGYTVIEASSAEEALEQLRDATLLVDVFVTDVIMPGKDGPTWVSEALKERPDTRVVFVSGYAEESFADGQARIPQSVFLPKPFSLSQLTETVEAQLH